METNAMISFAPMPAKHTTSEAGSKVRQREQGSGECWNENSLIVMVSSLFYA